MSKKKIIYKKENEISMKEYLDAQMELEKVQKNAGISQEEKGFSKIITKIFDLIAERKKHKVNKKIYIILAALLGWLGVHRFYEKRYILGFIYILPILLSFFNKDLINFVGVIMGMSLIDILIAVGYKADENGQIEI